MDKINVTKELNAVLKEERRAEQSYEKFISEADDEKIKNVFLQIRKNHLEHADLLAERIRSLGAVPDRGTGMAGIFSNMKLDMGTNGKNSVDILKIAYDEEDKGIAAVEKVIRERLDDISAGLVKDILSNDHGHLKSMLTLMSDIELQ